MKHIILASASPRRKELLTQIGLEYEVSPADIEEKITNTHPGEAAKELSVQKAQAAAERIKDGIIIGADTVVAKEEEILGKPQDAETAFHMLSGLQGKTHEVYTGVTLLAKEGGKVLWKESFYECTSVTMYEMSAEEIHSYISSGEPMDKAGAYGIQGLAGAFIKCIRGDYNNVVGLPVARIYQILKERKEL